MYACQKDTEGSLQEILHIWSNLSIQRVITEICMLVKKQQLELDMEQQTGSKSGKECIKAVYCHSACLTNMQSTLCKMPGWMKHKLESRLPGEISITSDVADDTTLMAESEEELESLLMKAKEENKKVA